MSTVSQANKRYNAGQPVTQNQIDFIKTLTSERRVPEALLKYNRNLWKVGSFNARAASVFIDTLLTFPVIGEKVKKHNEVLEGMHVIGDQVIRVKRSKNDNFYASVLMQQLNGKWSFNYSSGLISKLSKETRMTREQAEKFGKYYATCCVCAAELTDPESMRRGIGPVCAKKF